ncbi:putative Quercetin 2,3-dioxygenase [Frankia canadensis]|uniref:Putative Quercetin 2,3-dioxygenase n=1 Tax=Frankia canadensis TaxID=1836972 RepID=A0A2I2KWE7_9ACTN|nr:pirin family protein [Frankia canadensis]SNQ50007.1 putative Quercetin 2,3-dioxygenase [Frankia canadensis]SOU57297.1 putative Quercetin 2,3-dioxygenase [Frankia canadensis]
MSGPVPAVGVDLEVVDGRAADVGGIPVRRTLPRQGRRTVGAWCFVDQMGPLAVGPRRPVEIGPHPHIGLATVTWLLSGGLVHRDSLGSNQPLRPRELNLMTAGNGVAHAEASEDGDGQLHGVQLWVAQPDRTRHGPADFAHHPHLPVAGFGSVEVTVLLGELGGAASPARTDTPLVGAELALHGGGGVLPLRRDFEYAVIALDGAVRIGANVLVAGQLGYLRPGREELPIGTGPAVAGVPASGTGGTGGAGGRGVRAMLLGGEPFPEQVVMWWNLVARTRGEIEAARADWTAGAERFGAVATPAARVPAPVPMWVRAG